MARNYKFLVLLSLVLLIGPICEAAIINPVSDSHRSAALELFVPKSDGSYGSLEETYEALRTFEILGFTLGTDIKASTCKSVEDILWSPTSALKDLFQALRVNRILECELNDEAFTGIASRLKDNINEASSLHDFYYIIGSLGLIKDKSSEVDVYLGDADGVLRSIKALSQSDGRWRYSSNNPESSTYAAGMALETLAGVISLASTEIDQSLISTLKHDISKLFDGIEKYDDGAYYFDEKLVDADGYQSPLAASSSVIRGITAFASVSSETLDIPGDKILGLAKFFLGNGVPGRAKDLYYQIDALCYLQTNRFSIPLILSLPSTVLSLTKGDHLKVQVTTVLGSAAPPLSVKLMQIFSSESTDASLIDQELNYDQESSFFTMDALPESIDVGKYTFSFEIVLHDFEDRKLYVTGGRTKIPIYVTGIINVDQAEITVLNSDLESVENQKKLNLAGENNVVSLSANHLQKVRLSFQLTTPLGHTFKPQQAFFKLRHESKVEHIFLIGSSLKKHEIILDFLGLVEKFYYLSGKYELQLTVGDSAMENSFLQGLGHIELDFPKSHEKTLRPPVQPVDVYTRYGPKAEISHIFRVPDKRPPTQLSFGFSGLVILPLFGFLIGLLLLRVNLKNFPSATVPGLFAIMFHLGIGAVLLLYSLFWLKFNLFQTLKALGFLGVFLMFVGHRTLSHIASTSAKLKSS